MLWLRLQVDVFGCSCIELVGFRWTVRASSQSILRSSEAIIQEEALLTCLSNLHLSILCSCGRLRPRPMIPALPEHCSKMAADFFSSFFSRLELFRKKSGFSPPKESSSPRPEVTNASLVFIRMRPRISAPPPAALPVIDILDNAAAVSFLK